MSNKQEYQYSWNGIEVSISFQPNHSEVYMAVMGEALAHIEVKAAERLPITKTGYQSVFLPLREVQERGGVMAFVLGWLAETAGAREWEVHHFCYRIYSTNVHHYHFIKNLPTMTQTCS